MAQVGIVKTLEGGVFYAKDSSGNIRELSIGDSISENEVVYGDSSNQTSAKVEMELSGNDIIVLNQAQQQLIDSSLNQVTFGNEEVIFSKGDINTTFENADLSAWNNTTDDVSDDMETAAGDPTQQETQAGEEEATEEGRVTARFSARDGSSTNVVSDLRDTVDFGTQLSESDNDGEIAAELLNPQITATTADKTPTVKTLDVSITIDDITADNVINETEATQQIPVTGTVGGDAKEGDTVTLTVNGNTYTGTVKADLTYSIEVPGSDLASANNKVDATITITDTAGNSATDTADKTPTVKTLDVSITIDDITADNVINETEATQQIPVTGTVGGDAKEGDTVTLTVNGNTYTGTVKADLTYSIEVPGSDLASANNKVDATITITDTAGNSATDTADKTPTVKTLDVSITIDDITADNVINETEATQQIPVTGTVGGDAKEGDTVTLTVNGNTYTGTVKADLTYSIEVPGSDLASANNKVDATITITDTAGNSATDTADKTPTVKTLDVSITIDDITADNVINETEATQQIPVTGTVGGDAKEGDTVTLTVNGNTYTGTVKADLTYSIEVPGSDLASANNKVDATITITDTAGNSATDTADKTPTVKTLDVSITIDDITADNVINETEATQQIPVTGTVGGDAKEGDTVTLTVNGNTYTGTVKADLTYSIEVPGSDLASANNKVDATITITDTAGNSATDTADKTPTVKTLDVSITIDDITADNVINETEATQQIPVTGTVGGDAKEGDTVTLTVNGNTYTGTVKADLTYSIEVPGSDLASANNKVDATITITDTAGNSATDTADKTPTVKTLDVSITIDDITADNVINETEATQQIPVTGTVGGDAKEGDTVTLTVNGNTYTGTVKADLTYSIEVPGSDLASANNKVDATITITDTAGNSATDTADKTPTVKTLDVSITIDDITADNVINETEATQQIPVTGTVGGDAKEGDTVTLTVNGNTYTGTVKADLTYSIEVPGSDLASANNKVDATITITDTAGNSATDTADKTPTVKTLDVSITIDDITADNVINETEATQQIPVTGTVGGDAKEGDTVTLTVNGNTYTGTVKADLTYSIEVPGSDLASANNKVDATITITDTAGNSATDTADKTPTVKTLDVSITIDDITADNVINETEATQQIPVTGTVGGDAKEGDTVTLTVNGNTYTGTVKADLTYSIEVPGSDLASANNKVDATITITDTAGNSATDTADKTPTVKTLDVSITIDDITADNVINETEATQQIPVTGTVGGDAKEGDTVTLTVNGNTYTGTVKADLTYSIEVPGSDLASANNKVDATITITDTAGNSATDTADKTPTVKTLDVSITIDDITADNVINETEATQQIPVTGTVGGDAKEGDTVTLTVNGNTYTGTVKADLTYSIEVPGSDLASANNKVDATITITDTAGNSATDTADKTPTVKTLDVSITIDDITADNVINETEATQQIPVTGTVGGDAKEGDTVTLTVNGNTYTGTVKADLTYSIEVPGSDLASANNKVDATITITDTAGNSATDTADKTPTVKTLDVSITIDDITADNVINETEATQQIPVTGTVGGDAKEGDTVTLTVNGNTYTGTVKADLTYSIEVPGSDLASANNKVDATITITDTAGNSATDTADKTPTVKTLDVSITIDDITADNVINETEATQQIPVTGTVGGDAKEGDTVTLTVNGNTYTGTVKADLTYSIEVPGSDLASANNKVDATITITDTAGNSATDTADKTPTVKTLDVSITIDDITADNVINETEATQQIPVTGTVGGDAKEGDTVTLTVNGNTYTGTVKADLTYSIEVPGSDLASANNKVDATITITDTAGNSATDTADKTPTVKTLDVSITIDDITADNVINETEATQQIPVTGTVGGDAKEGDTVTLTVNGNTYTGTVKADLTYSIEVPGSDLASANNKVDATITITDTAGNSATDTADKTPTVKTLDVSITIDDITADNVINETEATQQIPVTGTVGGDAKEGDTVTLTVNGNTYTGTVKADLTYSIEVPGSDLASANNKVDATITITDTAGNSATDTADKTPTVKTLDVSITIDDITADNVINETEATQQIPVTGTVGGDAKEGDTVTLTVNGNTYTGTVKADLTYSIEVPGSDLASANNKVDATITITDTAGNSATDTADKTPTVKTLDVSITIDDITADNVINETEATQQIPVTGTVGGDAKEGDTVTLTVNGNTYTGTVKADLTYSIEVPGSDLASANNKVDATITITDTAGNSATDTADKTPTVKTLDVSITIDDITADNVINETEATQQIPVTGTVGGDAKEGDTVTLTVNGNTYTGTVKADLTYSIEVPGSDLASANNKVDATITITDTAGNSATDTADKTPTVKTLDVSITIDDITADNVINETEATQQIPVTGTVGGDAKEGDTVTLTVNGNTYTGTVKADLTYSIEVPGSDLASANNKVDATITITDTAGNSATDTADKTPTVKTLDVSITIDDITADNVINETEATQQIPVTGTVGGDAKEGDTVTLTVNGNTYTGTVKADLTYSIEVPGSDLASANNKVDATITITDTAGNSATDTADKTPTVKTLDVSITIDDITADNVINETEATQQIPVTGTVGGDAKEGDTVTLTVNGNTYTGTVKADLTYSIEVPGSDLASANNKVDATITITDTAGNSATDTADKTPTVKTLDVSITIDDITADNVINETEATQQIPVTGTVGGDAKEGDTVTLTVNGNTYTGTVKADLTYSIEVPGSDLASANNKVDATITITDTAGNSATDTADKTPTVKTLDVSITIDDITADNVINETEATQQIPVTGTVGGDAKEGDTVTLTVNGNTYTGTVKADLTYSIEVPGSDLASANNKVDATITITDTAGNSATDTADKTPTVKTLDVSITIDDITADNVINETEATQQIPVTGTVGGDAKEGDTVTLTVNGNTYTGTVKADLTYSIEVPGSDLASANNKVDATITITDTAGNSATDTADKTPTVKTLDVSITIDDITADNVINETEATQQIPVTGTVGGDAKEGDTVTLTVNGNTYTGTVKADLTYSIEVPGSDLASANNKVDATITITDTAGNSATDTADKTPTVKTLDVSITIDDITADNVINETEATQQIPVTGTVGGDAKEGDTVTLTVNGNTYTGTVKADLTYSIEVPGSDLASANNKVDATITITDTAGNSATDTADKTPTVKTLDVSITIDDITADNVINETEATQQIPVTGTVGGDAKEGDTVTLTVNGNTYTGTVKADLTYSIEVPGSDLASANNKVDATITITDTAGNSATDTADKTPTVKTLDVSITIDDITADNVINETEATQQIPVTGTVGGDAKEGDTVTLTVNGNTYTGTVKADLTYSIEVPGSDLASANNKVDATITITDTAGNSATASANKGYAVDTTPPIITLEGSAITESTTGEITGEKAKGTVTVKLDKAQSEDLVVKLKNEVTGEIQDVIIKAGETSTTVEVETSRVDDAYKQGVTKETISIVSTSDSKIDITDKTATITINDDNDGVDVTVSATATTPKVIDVNTEFGGTTGIKMYATDTFGNPKNIAIVKNTDHDGFGVEGKTTGSGDTKELGNLGNGNSEKIVIEFDKDVNSLDIAFAWRNNTETARVTFVDNGKVVGYAEVTGGGDNTKAKVNYYSPTGELIKSVEAQGGTDRVDLSYTFELPSKDGGLVSFDKVEFTAPNYDDDYLINKIAYKEVVNPDVTDIVTEGGKVTFDIQIDEKYPPQGKATAIVEIGGTQYEVQLNATGRGTLTIDAKSLGDLSKVEVKVVEVKGGNYEKVNSVTKEFDFTSSGDNSTPSSSDDIIITEEDTAHILKVTDFGNVSVNTKEFKITELPTNGKLYLIVTKGETIIDKDGNKTIATEDTKVEISKNQIVTLADVGAGRVVFEPTANSDADGQFKFQVGDGEGHFSSEYTTTIDVKAVADTPTVSIDITKVSETTNSSSESTTKIGTTDSINNIGTSGNDTIEVNKELVMNDKIDLKDGNDTLILNKNINIVTIDLGNGNDKVVINGQVNGTNNINLGSGDDVIKINNVVTNNTHINGGDGKDTLYLSGNKSDYIFNLPTNNNGMIEGSITDKKGGGTIQYNQMETIVFGDGSYIGQKPQEEAPAQTVFKVDISAALTDTDGSETLSVIIKNVPASATLESSKYEVSKNSDGSYTVKVPQGETSISDKLTMKVLQEDAKNINLQIEAKATEARDNEDGQNFKTATDSTTDKTPTLVVGSNKDSFINGGAGKDILIGDTGGTELNVQPGKNYNIALVVDTSGSMKEASGSKTAWGTTISRIDLLKDALKNLADSLKGHDGKINVSIIDFDTKSKQPITFNDLTSKNISDLITKIDALKAEGGTNYEDAFLKTTSWFDTQSVTYGKAQGYENLTYFLTDGDPTFSNRNIWWNDGSSTEYSDMKDAVDAFKTLSGQSTVHAIGIGNGINENYLRFFDNTDIIGQGNVSFGSWFSKQTVSGNIGKPDIVNTAEDLKAALQGGSVTEDILDVGSDTINGGDGDDIIFGDSINTDNLLWNGRFVEGHENYMSKGQGINALDKYLSITKSGYEDMTTLEKNMAKFDYIKEHHSDLNVEGDTRGGDDIISGGAGRDIIYGQGGDDTIITDLNTNNGKEDGDIIIDGGTGYDTLILEGDNNIDFSLLKDASITNIEAIDLTQGNHKLQNLTLDDVLKISGEDNTIKISGDEFDSVTFKNTVGDDGKENAWSKTEGTGADKGYDIYMNSGDLTVQVKVEQPISDGITN
ncbi:Ig-like domain-containing protein [Aliarcobacter butzleri]|uniref:Ig-like domain-containing protein n=3 Tax=Aliarcobacter butzleri TaxID=28197 RepID=UPI003AFA6B50